MGSVFGPYVFGPYVFGPYVFGPYVFGPYVFGPYFLFLYLLSFKRHCHSSFASDNQSTKIVGWLCWIANQPVIITTK